MHPSSLSPMSWNPRRNCISWKAMRSQKDDGKLGKLCYSCLRKDIAQPGGMEVFGFLIPFENHLEIFFGCYRLCHLSPTGIPNALAKVEKNKVEEKSEETCMMLQAKAEKQDWEHLQKRGNILCLRQWWCLKGCNHLQVWGTAAGGEDTLWVDVAGVNFSVGDTSQHLEQLQKLEMVKYKRG